MKNFPNEVVLLTKIQPVSVVQPFYYRREWSKVETPFPNQSGFGPLRQLFFPGAWPNRICAQFKTGFSLVRPGPALRGPVRRPALESPCAGPGVSRYTKGTSTRARPRSDPANTMRGRGLGSFALPICTLLCLMGPASAQDHISGVTPRLSLCILIHAARSPDLPGLLRTDAAWYSELTQPDAGTIDMHWQQIYPQLSKHCR